MSVALTIHNYQVICLLSEHCLKYLVRNIWDIQIFMKIDVVTLTYNSAVNRLIIFIKDCLMYT